MPRFYMSYVWRMWRKRDIRCDDKCETMYYHKAGSLCILQIMYNLSIRRKVVFVLSICGLVKINELNWLKFVRREFLSFVKLERPLPLLVRALFLNERQRKSALEINININL